MKFGTKQIHANRITALALVTALIEHLQESGALSPADQALIIKRAQRLAPQDVGMMATEAREILATML